MKPLLRNSVMPMISGACERIAGHPQAAMQPAEMDVFTDLTCALLDKYAPNALNKWGLEITAAAMIGQYGVRVYMIRQQVQAAIRQQADAARASHAPGPEPDFSPEVVPSVRLVEKDLDDLPKAPHADH